MQAYELEPIFKLAIQKMRWLIISVFITGALCSWYALSLPNTFRVVAILYPQVTSSSPTNNLAGLASSLGGLSAITGLSFSNNSGETNVALARARSHQFLAFFINKYDLKRELHYELWDDETDSWIALSPISKIFGNDTGIQGFVDSESSFEPTDQESVALLRDLLAFVEQPEFGTIEASLIWPDRTAGVELLTLLIDELNLAVRTQERSRLRDQNDYLVNELSSESREPIRVTLQSLIRINSEKLASMVNEDYAFAVLDPAVEPLKRFAPNRTRIVLGWVSAVTLLYGISVFFLYMRRGGTSKL